MNLSVVDFLRNLLSSQFNENYVFQLLQVYFEALNRNLYNPLLGIHKVSMSVCPYWKILAYFNIILCSINLTIDLNIWNRVASLCPFTVV